MTTIGLRHLLPTYLVVAGGAFVVLRLFELRGTDPFPVPISVIAVLLLVSGLVLYFGLRVRKWVRDGKEIDAIGATRTLALGQAAAIVGAMQGGYFTAQIIAVFPALPAPEAQSVTISASFALVAAAFMIAAGLLAQACCRVPPDDDDPTNTPTP